MRYLRQIVGLIIGVAVFAGVNFLAGIVFGIILSIPFLSQILSYPSTPMLWAGIGGNGISIFLGYIAVRLITKVSDGKPNPAAIMYCTLLSAVSIYLTWQSFGYYGGDMIWVNLFSVVLLAGLGYGAYKGEPI
jgi:hypothetical protein